MSPNRGPEGFRHTSRLVPGSHISDSGVARAVRDVLAQPQAEHDMSGLSRRQIDRLNTFKRLVNFCSRYQYVLEEQTPAHIPIKGDDGFPMRDSKGKVRSIPITRDTVVRFSMLAFTMHRKFSEDPNMARHADKAIQKLRDVKKKREERKSDFQNTLWDRTEGEVL